jgi:Long-chain fatty aldehyde decarbonylase
MVDLGNRSTDRSDARGLSRVFPDLEDDLLLHLFHKGARAQWTSRDLEYAQPQRLSAQQRQALARLLTPVYFGEQTAMVGASGVLPQLMRERETTAQLYLASFIMDEARHFEALTRLYRSLEYDPLGLRDIPELLLYHHRLRQGDRADWVWGILISDVIAKHFYRSFGPVQSDPLWSGLSKRILRDESRHLAFAEHYLRRNVPRMELARRQAMLHMRDDLFRLLEAMTERVRADAAVLEVDADDYLDRVRTDVESFAARVGLTDSDPPRRSPPDRLADSEKQASAATEAHRARTTFAISLPECFGCLLILICGRPLTTA